jgi:hypothetical protein
VTHFLGRLFAGTYFSPGLEAMIEAKLSERRQFLAAHQETTPMETLSGAKLV